MTKSVPSGYFLRSCFFHNCRECRFTLTSGNVLWFPVGKDEAEWSEDDNEGEIILVVLLLLSMDEDPDVIDGPTSDSLATDWDATCGVAGVVTPPRLFILRTVKIKYGLQTQKQIMLSCTAMRVVLLRTRFCREPPHGINTLAQDWSI